MAEEGKEGCCGEVGGEKGGRWWCVVRSCGCWGELVAGGGRGGCWKQAADSLVVLTDEEDAFIILILQDERVKPKLGCRPFLSN